MKQIYLQIKSDEDILYDDKINCIYRDNVIVFSLNEEKYSIDLEKKMIKKENKDSIIFIEISNENIVVKLTDYQYSFDMPIKIANFVNNSKQFRLKYLSETKNIVDINIRL